MRKGITFLVLWMGCMASGQEFQSTFTVDALGVLSSEESNPFWFRKNTQSRVGESTQYSGLFSWHGSYRLNETSYITGGSSLFYRDGVNEELQRETLYIQYTNPWLKATLGSQSLEDPTEGLSSTAKNFLYSGNARPLPGMLLEANEPIHVGNRLSIDWGIGHFLLNDDRYVKNPYVHYKRLGINWEFNRRNSLSARIQHFVVWAGTSPEYGKLSKDLDAYIDVFFATKPESDPVPGEALNALGNHLGSYFLEYRMEQDWGMLEFYHEHPFEDGSGSGWANFPDGIWGLQFKPQNRSVFNSALYEYIDTTNQSEGTSSGADNYFSNSVYRSGWTYEGNIIGLPFILNDPDLEITPNNSPIVSNRLRAHQFGVKGNYRRFEWILKSSIVTNYLRSDSDQSVHFWYNGVWIYYATEKFGVIRTQIGWDNGSKIDARLGIGLGYYYHF